MRIHSHQKTGFNNQRLFFFGILLVVCTVCFIPHCVSVKKIVIEGASEEFIKKNTFDRSGFGNSKLQLWYGLTEFEEVALSKREAAIQGDPEALLALAIFSSGNVRDMSTYEQYRSRVTAFVEKIRPEVEKCGDDEKKGAVIFQHMTNAFFKQWAGGDELLGYRFEQSQLTELFRTGHFNCISSSLLYIVCCRYFGLNVKGVEIPSHIFVQLETSAGKKIDIETTIKTGYGLVHDKKFYAQSSQAWLKSRKLKDAAFEDYLNRTIHEPYQLIAGNMFNQHTDEKRMAQIDRNRLLEASGYLNSSNARCVKNRLIIYNNEYCYFKGVKDDRSIVRMFQKVGSLLSQLLDSWARNTSMSGSLANFMDEYYYAQLANNAENEALSIVSDAVKLLSLGDTTYVTLVNNILLITNIYLDRLVKKKEFGRTLLYLDRLGTHQQLQEGLIGKRRYIHEEWAFSFWEKNDWEQAAVQYMNAFRYAGGPEEKKRVLDNLTSTYINWSNVFWEKGAWPEAIEKCSTALEYAQSEEKKQLALNNMAGAYANWGNEFTAKKNWAGALEKLTLSLQYAKTEDRKTNCSDAIAVVYYNWALIDFAQEKWSAAIEKFLAGLPYAKSSDRIKIFSEKLETGYIRWYYEKSRDKALQRTLMEQCVQKCPECLKCKERLSTLKP